MDNRGTIHTFSINNHGTTVMARPVTVTKERILSASLDLVRSGGLPLLTARNLCAKPRYIQDEEWAELERMLRNSSDFRPESLREEHPGLTKGDIRAYILSHLQFSVSEQAILLGISPASVTKARQRLKAKL